MRIKVDSTKAAAIFTGMKTSSFSSHWEGFVTLGEERVPSSAGAMLYAPTGVRHGIENTGPDVLTWCAVYSPPGFEQFFKEVGVPSGQSLPAPTPEQTVAVALKYGMVYKNP
jgi:hypothetical protein